MRIIVTFLFLAAWISSFAQNYQTISSDRTSIFETNNSQSMGCFSTFFAIEIDSSKVIDGNQVFYFFNTIEYNYNSEGCPIEIPTWIGSKVVIDPAGNNFFFNQNKDTILIKSRAEVGDKWKLYKESNDHFLEAEVVSISEGSVLGISDVLKVVRLQYKDGEGNALTHSLNNKEIVLSKSYGMVQFLNMLNFPSDKSYYSLIGLSNPHVGVQNITAREIYDYAIGDEIHFEMYNGNVAPTFSKEKKLILDKSISANFDTLTYKVQQTSLTYFAGKQEYTEDTLIEKIIVSQNKKWNSVPKKFNKTGDVDIPNFVCSCLSKSSYGQRIKKKMSSYPIYREENNCFVEISLSGPPVDIYAIEGLGEYYEYFNEMMNAPERYKKLVYYKKGSETWGTPLVLSTTTSSSLLSSISPNPFKEDIKFELKQNGSYELELSTVYGSVVKRVAFDGSEITLHNEGWQGVYLYKILSNNVVVGLGKVVAY